MKNFPSLYQFLKENSSENEDKEKVLQLKRTYKKCICGSIGKGIETLKE